MHNRFKDYLSSIIACIMFVNGISAQEKKVDGSYRESVELQVGREIYIAGETIRYKAFTFSNQQIVYSKVLYVELVDSESRHIMGQILQIKDGTADAALFIPDTLASGTYSLKAYTNWMRNFSPVNFASSPIYIFNQYDDEKDEIRNEYSLLLQPTVYIENGALIQQALTRVKVGFNGWMSDSADAYLIETLSEKKQQEFIIDRGGNGIFSFIPALGKQYRIECKLSDGNTVSFELPAVQAGLPALNFIAAEKGTLLIQPINLEGKYEDTRLTISSGERQITEQKITTLISDTLAIQLPTGVKGILTIRLWGKGDKILAQKRIYFDGNSNEKIGSVMSSYFTRTQVEIPVSKLIGEDMNPGNFSVSIYKCSSSDQAWESIKWIPDFNERLTSLYTEKGYAVFLTDYAKSDENSKIVYEDNLRINTDFAIEDIGVLYTGKVVNSLNEGPLAGLGVILAIKDTIPQLLFSSTDTLGRFVFLIDDYGEKHAMINLYMKGTQLSGNFKILLDKKFYFQEKLQLVSEETLPKDQAFVQYLDDEAQRVLIQKAFAKKETIADTGTLITRNSPFYGDPMMVVYPSEFFDLPNFEEISREILPRVHYKKTKSGCELTIYHTENGLKTSSPIVLLDGLPVKDYCELYPMKSEDVNRIEMLSGMRAAGNLYYEGLLAVYSSPKYKAENPDKNGRVAFDVSGYHVNSEFQQPEYINKDESQLKRADFRNQLYWEANIPVNETGYAPVRFNTSDEEGFYVIELCGYGYNGQLLCVRKRFEVASE
jgi:hypothetical protein